MKRPCTPAQGQGFVQPESSHGDILIRHKSESRIDSRVISERAGIQHESIIATIKSHQVRLRELGSLPRQSLKELTDLKSGKSGRKRGRPEISYLLNELQLDYLLRVIRGRNAERMNQFKLDVTKAFAKHRAGGPVWREYLHDAGMAGKTKATRIRGRQWENTKHKHGNHNRCFSGGQRCQSGGRPLDDLISLGRFAKKSSIESFFTGFSTGSGGCISLARASSCWRAMIPCKSSLLCSAKISSADLYFLLIGPSCKAMRRSTSHHSAGGSYPLLLQGYTPVFRTNASLNTSDHISKKAVYTESIPYKTGIGILTPQELEAIHDAPASFFVSAHTHTSTMVGCMGPTSVGLVSSNASCENPVQSTASELLTSGGGDNPKVRGAFHMAVSARPYFVWRFMQCHHSNIDVFTVTAATEREAREQLPHAHLIFVARIRQGVTHV